MLLNPLLKALNGVIQEQIKTNEFIHATDMGKPTFTPRINWNIAFADRQTNKNIQSKGTEIKMW
jgi:hypothetical protein